MSAGSAVSRISVFAVFATLSVLFTTLLRPGVPAQAPTVAELEAFEKAQLAGARLHRAEAPPEPTGSAVYCVECHPAPPHPGSGLKEALANEHASRMDCLLCHWSSANGSRPAPAWQAGSGTAAFLGVLPRERSSKAALETLRSAVTAGRRCFERGPACGGCHRAGGIAQLARPGTSPARLASLERLENYFALAPGEKWYLPQMQ